MNTINELRKISEKERMEWIINAKSSYLNIVLKNAGVKGISRMKKLEKIVMVTKLVEDNIADEDAKRVMEDTRKLNKELSVRRSFEDFIECTLYARYKNREITYNELKNTCDKYNLDIPLNDDEESSINFIDKHCDMFSTYEHDDEDGNIYYALFDAYYQWDNMHRKDNICNDDDWDIQEFYKINTVDKNGLQLAFTYDNELHYVLCVYKDYELLATYVEGSTHKINELVAYDNRLTDEDLSTYEELLGMLQKQCEEYWKILKADEILKKKLNCTQDSSRQLIIDELNRSKNLNSNIHLNNELLK